MRSVLYLGASMAPLVALGTGRRMGDGEVHLQRPAAHGGASGAGPTAYTLIQERDPSRALR